MDAIITLILFGIIGFKRKKDTPPKSNQPVWKTTGDGVKNEAAFLKLFNAIMGGADSV